MLEERVEQAAGATGAGQANRVGVVAGHDDRVGDAAVRRSSSGWLTGGIRRRGRQGPCCGGRRGLGGVC